MLSTGEQLDECNRLWVLDTGKVGDDMVCDPKLLAFDLATNMLVQRIDIPPKLARNADGVGLLSYLVVDTIGPECGGTNVIIKIFVLRVLSDPSTCI